MSNAVAVLTSARQILSDEQRWTTGQLVENVDLEVDPLCNNVRVCALGAIGLAAYGPAGAELMANDDLDEDSLETNSLTADAVRILNAVSENLYGEPAYSINDLTYDPRIGLDVPDLPREERYQRILDLFDRAIERAKGDQAS